MNHWISNDLIQFCRFKHLSQIKQILILKNTQASRVTVSFRNFTRILNSPSPVIDLISLQEEDLYEELLRSYGYDNIPISKPTAGPITKNRQDNVLDHLRLGFVHSGFKELMHMPFVSRESFQQLNSNNLIAAELQNPINESEPLLRGNLFRPLFAAINSNIKKDIHRLKFLKLATYLKKREIASPNHCIYQE